MPYKTGAWGNQAKNRSKNRTKYFLDYRSRHKKEWKARRLVEYAVKHGKLKKKKCRDCGSEKVQAHHFDYNQPLKVIWLCPLHHRQEHKRQKAR